MPSLSQCVTVRTIETYWRESSALLNANRLQVLHAVARLGSLTAAAAELNYTTSAVSQQISLLERETGTTLVERHARGVRLTEPGRVLAIHAATILAELDAADAALAAVTKGQEGWMRFGSFPSVNAVLMPRAVAAFQQAHPRVDVHLRELERDEGLRAVRDHELDLALVYEFPGVPLPVVPDVELVTLLTDPLYIMLDAGNPLADGDLRLTDLADQPWIQGVDHGSTLNVLPVACRNAGFEPVIRFRTGDQVTVQGLVAAGIGIALTPWSTISMLPQGVVARPLREPALVRTVMAALPRPPLPTAEAMVAILGTVVH
jgi:DNA-binding transcriptional LysR family regulator